MTGRTKKPAPGERIGTLDGLVAAESERPGTLPLGMIVPSTQVQPRRHVGESNIERLAEVIRGEGVLQPLLVRPVGGKYEIVDGERRWLAAGLAGLSEVPVLIRDLSDVQARRAALVTVLQREGLEIIDEVDATLALVADVFEIRKDAARHRLMALLASGPQNEQPQLEALFTLLGKESWQSFAKNKLRILNWPEQVLAAMRDQGLAYTIAGIIAAAPAEHQAELLGYALSRASKAEVRAQAKRLTPPKSRRIDRQRTILMARKLASERWLASLNDQDEKELEAWLNKMPERIRQAVEPG